PVVVPARTGRKLDRTDAAEVVVHALAGLTRALVTLPVLVEPPSVTAGDLAPAAAQARRALSAPVGLQLGPTRWRLPRWRLAELLALPASGSRSVGIGGPAADRWFERLRRQVDHPAVDADFAVYSDGVRVIPAGSDPGRRDDEARAARGGPFADAAGRSGRGRHGCTEAHDGRRGGHAHHGPRLELRDVLRRRRQPDPQRPARLAPH